MPLTTKALIDNLGTDLHAVDVFRNNALSIAHYNHDDLSEQLLRKAYCRIATCLSLEYHEVDLAGDTAIV